MVKHGESVDEHSSKPDKNPRYKCFFTNFSDGRESSLLLSCKFRLREIAESVSPFLPTEAPFADGRVNGRDLT